jgi:glycosyltransferase involved in cell wall biosynthesis
MEARGDLAGMRILVDTYNLRLPTGTGIKTYGLSLIEALQRLQVEVSLLTDVRKPKTRYPQLDEVLIYDVKPAVRQRWWRVATAGLRGLRGVFKRPRAERVQIDKVIPDDRFGEKLAISTLFNLPQCYRLADATYRSMRRLTRLKPPSKVDVWHATCQLPLRVRGAQQVTTIHDLIPLKLPYTTLDDKRVFYSAVRDALRDSALIFAVSECTKRDLLSFYDVPEEKIIVTYQALPNLRYWPGEAFATSVLEQYSLRQGEYLLFVGNIEPKKNVRMLLRAVSMLQTRMPLVVVGRKAWLWEELVGEAQKFFGSQPRYEERVRWLGDIPSLEVGALYANAACLVFPSLYEGFGLPPLEAMRFGCPVITSNVSSLPEICGNAALYVDPHEPTQIAEAIANLLADQELQVQLITAGYKRVEFFSMENYAERLLMAYSQLLV